MAPLVVLTSPVVKPRQCRPGKLEQNRQLNSEPGISTLLLALAAVGSVLVPSLPCHPGHDWSPDAPVWWCVEVGPLDGGWGEVRWGECSGRIGVPVRETKVASRSAALRLGRGSLQWAGGHPPARRRAPTRAGPDAISILVFSPPGP